MDCKNMLGEKDKIYDEFTTCVSGSVLRDEPLKNHSYFKIGGPADIFIEPDDIDDIKNAFSVIKKHGIDYYVIGNGTNLLVSDDGFRGAIIKVGQKFNYITRDGNSVTVGAGTLLSALSKYLAEECLAGFEFACGIPGYIGGAISMNAGAYGGEMKDVVKSVKCIDSKGNLSTYSNGEMEFSYRLSKISNTDMVVLEAELYFEDGNSQDIYDKMKALNEQRISKQPLSFPSAGSTFKRPSEGYASKLIEDAGLKGLIYRGAMVSDKHSGFIVNFDNASCSDVLELMRVVIGTVYDKFGIKLEPEIKILGTSLYSG